MHRVGRSLLVTAVVFVLVGCATTRANNVSLPPRYVEPSLPPDQLAIVVAIGNNIGVLFVDGAIVCDSSDYNMEGLKKAKPGPFVRLAPGTHELTFACWWTSGYTRTSTKMAILPGRRYKAVCNVQGYSVSLSVKLEE